MKEYTLLLCDHRYDGSIVEEHTFSTLDLVLDCLQSLIVDVKNNPAFCLIIKDNQGNEITLA